MSLKAPRASPGKPIVFAPHERAATLDDVLEAIRRLEDTVGEQWLATSSQLGTLSKRLQRLERRLAKWIPTKPRSAPSQARCLP